MEKIIKKVEVKASSQAPAQPYVPAVYLYVHTDKKLFNVKMENTTIENVKEMVKKGMAERIWDIGNNILIITNHIISCEIKEA